MRLYLTRDHPESETPSELVLWTEKPEWSGHTGTYLPNSNHGNINLVLKGEAEKFFLWMIKRDITYKDGVFVVLKNKISDRF